MNHLSVYVELIKSRKNLNRKKIKNGEYFEKHNICSKAIFKESRELYGEYFGIEECESKENYVLLTAREHFIAHRLIAKLFPKMVFAVIRMMAGKDITSKKFQKLREDHRIQASYRSLYSMVIRTEEERAEYARKYLIGENNPNYGNGWKIAADNHHTKRMSPEELYKWKYIDRYYERTEEFKEKYLIGENNPNYGNGEKISGSKNPSAKTFIFTYSDGTEDIIVGGFKKYCKSKNFSGTIIGKYLKDENYRSDMDKYSTLVKVQKIENIKGKDKYEKRL